MACIHRLSVPAGYVLARSFVSAVNNAVLETGSCPGVFCTCPCQDRISLEPYLLSLPFSKPEKHIIIGQLGRSSL